MLEAAEKEGDNKIEVDQFVDNEDDQEGNAAAEDSKKKSTKKREIKAKSKKDGAVEDVVAKATDGETKVSKKSKKHSKKSPEITEDKHSD